MNADKCKDEEWSTYTYMNVIEYIEENNFLNKKRWLVNSIEETENIVFYNNSNIWIWIFKIYTYLYVCKYAEMQFNWSFKTKPK